VTWNEDAAWDIIIASNGDWLQVFPQLIDLILTSRTDDSKQDEYLNQSRASNEDTNYAPAPSIKLLMLVGRLPRRLLKTLNLPSLERLILEFSDTNLSSIAGVSHLSFAREAEGLAIFDNRGRLPGKDWQLSHLLMMPIPFRELREVAIEKTLWDQIEFLEKHVEKRATTLQGKEVYVFEVLNFVNAVAKLYPLVSLPPSTP
jgi:hypothetical protein